MKISSTSAHRSDLTSFQKVDLTVWKALGRNSLLRALYRIYFNFPEWIKICFEFILVLSATPLFFCAVILESDWARERSREEQNEIEGLIFGLFFSILIVLGVFVPYGWIPGAMTLYFFVVTKMSIIMAEYHSELHHELFLKDENGARKKKEN